MIYTARPIQMKAAWTQSFIIGTRQAKFPGLVLACVWHLGDRPEGRDLRLQLQRSAGRRGGNGLDAHRVVDARRILYEQPGCETDRPHGWASCCKRSSKGLPSSG